MARTIYDGADEMEQYTAAIIGCGSIGALKDNKYDYPDGKNILTHAHALYDNKQISEIFFIDTDLPKAEKAAAKWNSDKKTWAMKSISDIVIGGKSLDIAIIATPTEFHYDILEKVMFLCDTRHRQPKAIIIEKPCGISLYKTQRIQILIPKSILIFINYSRRYNHHYQELANELQDKKIFHCRIAYTRGFKREACHALDLCNWWFGKFHHGKILRSYQLTIDDFSQDDLTRAVWLSYKKCPHVFFCPSDGRIYGVFEIDIFTEDGRIRLIDNGRMIKRYNVISEPIYGSNPTLDSLSTLSMGTSTNIEKTCLPNLYENVIATIEGRSEPICGIKDAIRVHEIYNYLGI